MKQTTQRIVCLLIGIVLICSFAGCSGPVNPVITQPNTEPSTTVGSVENQTTAPNTTDATTVPLETEPTPTEQTGTEPVETEPSASAPSVTEPQATAPSSAMSLEQLRELVNRISGRWYLDGFEDVYVDIRYDSNEGLHNAYMYIESCNFSLKDNVVNKDDGSYHINDYTVYPFWYWNAEKYPNGFSWRTGMEISLSLWDRELSEYDVHIEDNCIYMGMHKFVRTKGTRNQQTEWEDQEEPPVTEPEDTTVEIADVSFSIYEHNLIKGSSITIQTIITPANATEALIWESSNNSVATVNNGIVTAVGNGTAVITATAPNGDYASCVVTVYTPVSGVSMGQGSYTVCRNNSVTISVSVLPADASNKRLIWSSSDSSVVRIRNGKAVGVSNGTAIITVQTEDGGFRASCSVTVVDAPVSVECDLWHVTSIDGWKEGLKASVVVIGGSGNYSSYTFNISIYHEDGRMVASGNNIIGNSFNSGWIATLEVALSDITGGGVGPDADRKEYRGRYTAVFEIVDDEGNAYSGTATYVWE